MQSPIASDHPPLAKEVTPQEPAAQAPPQEPPVPSDVLPAQAVPQPSTQPLNLQITEDQVNSVVQAITDTLGGRQLSPNNMLRVVTSVYSLVINMKNLNQRLQKTVIITGLETFIDKKSGLAQAEQQMLNLLLETVVNEAIDIYQDIENGDLSLKKVKSCCTLI